MEEKLELGPKNEKMLSEHKARFKKYKLRAECSYDIVLFLQKAHGPMLGFKMEGDTELYMPDVEFEFETILTIERILDILKDIDDSHVMYETVQLLEQYTGDRDNRRARSLR
jgi:hypothetical protein